MENLIKVIKALSKDEIVFLKKINLENTRFSGVLCYARKPYDGYSMRPIQKDQFERNMYGYQEEEYPSDMLDVKILECIRQQFPNAICQTSILMFDSEVERNQYWLSQHKKEVFQIHLNYVPSTPPYTGATGMVKEIEIYYYPLPEEKLNRLNENLLITTDNFNDYKRYESLLNNTYKLFSNVIK